MYTKNTDCTMALTSAGLPQDNPEKHQHIPILRALSALYITSPNPLQKWHEMAAAAGVAQSILFGVMGGGLVAITICGMIYGTVEGVKKVQEEGAGKSKRAALNALIASHPNNAFNIGNRAHGLGATDLLPMPAHDAALIQAYQANLPHNTMGNFNGKLAAMLTAKGMPMHLTYPGLAGADFEPRATDDTYTL